MSNDSNCKISMLTIYMIMCYFALRFEICSFTSCCKVRPEFPIQAFKAIAYGGRISKGGKGFFESFFFSCFA